MRKNKRNHEVERTLGRKRDGTVIAVEKKLRYQKYLNRQVRWKSNCCKSSIKLIVDIKIIQLVVAIILANK